MIAHVDPDWVGRRLVVGPDSTHGSLGSTRADAAVADDAAGLLAAGRSEVLTYGPDGQRRGAGMEVFVAGYAPRPRMLVFGAIDFAAALARQGSLLGYRVTVCDARPVFATRGAVPDRRRGRRRMAEPLPGGAARRGRDRRPHRHLRAHPRPEVRRSAAGGRAAAARDRLRGRDGVAAHPRRPAGPAAGGRSDRSRADPAAQPDRARPRRAHPRGDRGVDRRRDHRPQVGRPGPPADRNRRPDPPRNAAS